MNKANETHGRAGLPSGDLHGRRRGAHLIEIFVELSLHILQIAVVIGILHIAWSNMKPVVRSIVFEVVFENFIRAQT